MKIIILPYILADSNDIVKTIIKDSMNVNIENTKREKETATVSYSIKQKKFVIADESGITQKDIVTESKNGWESLGNGISKGTINKKPCSWIVCHKGTDLSKQNIEKLIEIIRQHNLRLEHG